MSNAKKEKVNIKELNTAKGNAYKFTFELPKFCEKSYILHYVI